jgi:dihydropteroate synthase
MASADGDAVWSIETRYHEVAEAALSAGFEMVNDVCGFADPEMPRVCEEYDVAVAKMASPPDLERPGALEDVDWAGRSAASPERSRGYADDIYDALARNGFTDKTLVDPAFGGWSEEKTLEDDRETFHRLREFRGYGRPILVSINRKNFLREIAGRSTEEALPVSLAATAMAVERGAHVVRTHDVAETRDAALVGQEFARERVRDPAAGVEELAVTTDREFGRHLRRVTGDGGADPVVTHVVELRLPDDAEADLARRARAEGVRAYRGDALLLVGTAEELRSLRSAVESGPESAARALERACEGCEGLA